MRGIKQRLFGNRAERRGRSPRRQPTIEELPPGLQGEIATVSNFATVEQMLRASSAVEGFTVQQIQQAVSWLRQCREHHEREAAKHPRFAEFFPEAAAKLELAKAAAEGPSILGPDGQPAQT